MPEHEHADNKVYIQKISPENYEEVIDLIHDNLVNVNSEYYPKEVIDYLCEYMGKDNFETRLGELKECFVIVLDKHFISIVGVGGWEIIDDKKAAMIDCIFVQPYMHGLGLGKKIMLYLEQRIAENGFKEIHLNSSLNAVSFYERLGYEKKELQDNGELGNTYFMTKKISP